MFSIPHLIIVFIVALVVFGPEKLPELARNVGKLMAEFRRATGDLRSTFEGHLRDLEREADLRRISGPTTSPAVSSSSPTTSSNSSYSASPEALNAEVSTALGAAGTVPTTPAHLGIGTPVVEPSTAETTPQEPASTPPPEEASPQAAVLTPEHNPESLTDAGNRPA